MSHNISIKTASLFASLGVVAAFVLVSPINEAEAGDSGPVVCEELNARKYPEAVAACRKVSGNRKAMKRVMKEALAAYQAKNDKDKITKCQSCHERSGGGELSGDADELWAGYKRFLVDATKANK